VQAAIFFYRNDVQAIDFLRKGSYAPVYYKTINMLLKRERPTNDVPPLRNPNDIVTSNFVLWRHRDMWDIKYILLFCNRNRKWWDRFQLAQTSCVIRFLVYIFFSFDGSWEYCFSHSSLCKTLDPEGTYPIETRVLICASWNLCIKWLFTPFKLESPNSNLC